MPDKLMTLRQVIGGKLGSKSSNSTMGAATSLLNEYDGLQVGFELEKQAEETANPEHGKAVHTIVLTRACVFLSGMRRLLFFLPQNSSFSYILFLTLGKYF